MSLSISGTGLKCLFRFRYSMNWHRRKISAQNVTNYKKGNPKFTLKMFADTWMKPKWMLGRAKLAQRFANGECESMCGNWVSAERSCRVYIIFSVKRHARTHPNSHSLALCLSHSSVACTVTFETCVVPSIPQQMENSTRNRMCVNDEKLERFWILWVCVCHFALKRFAQNRTLFVRFGMYLCMSYFPEIVFAKAIHSLESYARSRMVLSQYNYRKTRRRFSLYAGANLLCLCIRYFQSHS